MNLQPKLRWLLTTIAIVACIIIVGLLLPDQETAPPLPQVMIMKMPYVTPAPKVGLLDRVMPTGPSWGPLWKVRYAIFGKPRVININMLIIDLKDLDSTLLTPANKSDLITEEGLKVWRTQEADFKSAQQLLKDKPNHHLSSPRLTTGDKIVSTMYSGSGNPLIINGARQQPGVHVDLLPIIRKDTLDLTAIVRCSEAITNSAGAITIRTNLEVAGRFQLSQGTNGVLILAPPSHSTEEKRLAFLMTSTVQRSKK